MLYNKNDAARLLSVSVRTVDRAVAEGRLNCHRIDNRLRFTMEDLEKFVGGRFVNDEGRMKAPKKRGVVPPEIMEALEKELAGVSHGTITLAIHLRDGRPRFVVGRERSFIPDPDKTGDGKMRKRGT
jgi:excisionase family DNA binding protein